MEDIEKFLKELQRVGKRGYIETPGPVSELFLNEPSHLWMVKKEKDILVFKKRVNSSLYQINSMLYSILMKKDTGIQLITQVVNF